MNDILQVLCTMAAFVSGLVFFMAQGSLCKALPEEWFMGFVSGMVFFSTCYILYRNHNH